MNRRKRILLVNNNMKIGGVQKALLEVLRQIHQDYDVTLLLFQKTGALLEQIPSDVRVTESNSDYRYLGISQKECISTKERLTRGFYAVMSKCVGISWTLKLMNLTVPRKESEEYDLAISFLHCAGYKTCYGGVAEYTLAWTKAKRYACYIHCDYLHAGLCSKHSRKVYNKYDQIICVSESVRKAFLEVQPELSNRAVAIANPLSPEQIHTMATEEEIFFDPARLNLIAVSRLAREKGLDRLIRALSQIENSRICCYIIGDGPEKDRLKQMVVDLGLGKNVVFLGEKENPYPYMAAADLLCVASYHEAAPVVFQEAKVLGLPILTTQTLSAKEMVPQEYGFVVDHSEDEIKKVLEQLNQDDSLLISKKRALHSYQYSSNYFQEEFQKLIPD